MGQTDAQKRATKNYALKNKDKKKYIALKSSAKTFITNYSNLDDLLFLKKLLLEQEHKLTNNNLIQEHNSVVEDINYLNLSEHKEIIDRFYSNLEELLFLKKLLLEPKSKLANNRPSLTLTDHEKDVLERFNSIIESNKLDIEDKEQKAQLIELYYKQYNIQKRTAQNHFNKIYLAHTKQE